MIISLMKMQQFVMLFNGSNVCVIISLRKQVLVAMRFVRSRFV